MLKTSSMPPDRIPLWVLILGSGLVLLPDPLYTSSLPHIANFFHATSGQTQHTMTAYLVGLAAGILIWGPLSDRWGRKTLFIIGILLFIGASWGCFFANSIVTLMIMRGLQGGGASVGSVISQAMARDVYTGGALRRVYSFWSASLALFPALSPLLGGAVASFFGWRHIFIVLMGFGGILLGAVSFFLPETLKQSSPLKYGSLRDFFILFIRDKQVLKWTFLAALSGSISFIFYGQAPFYLIKSLGLSQRTYEVSLGIVAMGALAGGITAGWWGRTLSSHHVISRGANFMTAAAMMSMLSVGLFKQGCFGSVLLAVNIILCQTFMEWSRVCIGSTVYAIALQGYQHHIGLASSLLGFLSYSVLAMVTGVMGFVSSESLWGMPLCFLALAAMIQGINRLF